MVTVKKPDGSHISPGETLTLHEAISLIAFKDPTKPLRLPVTPEILKLDLPSDVVFDGKFDPFVDPDPKQKPAVSRIPPDGPQMRLITEWLDQSHQQKLTVARATTILERAINAKQIPINGCIIIPPNGSEQDLVLGLDEQGSFKPIQTAAQYPIAAEILARPCKIPLEFLYLDGGRVLFGNGTNDRGYEAFLTFREVSLLWSAVAAIPRIEQTTVKPDQGYYNRRANEFVEQCHAEGRVPTRREIKEATGAPEKAFRIALSSTDKSKRHGAGAPRKSCRT